MGRCCCINTVAPLGGVCVQPSADAGTGQAAASGEGEGGGADPPEARAEEPSKYFAVTITCVLTDQ